MVVGNVNANNHIRNGKMPDDFENKIEIAILKKDLDLLSSLVDKFDNAIDRLTIIASSVDKILAVHEARLKNQEIQTELLNTHAYTFEKEIKKELGELQDRNTAEHRTLSDRIDKFETWRWFIIGISAGVGFLLAQGDIISKLLK